MRNTLRKRIAKISAPSQGQIDVRLRTSRRRGQEQRPRVISLENVEFQLRVISIAMLLVTSTDITVWIVSALLALGIGVEQIREMERAQPARARTRSNGS